jgi:outer membrane beta-barrel protein
MILMSRQLSYLIVTLMLFFSLGVWGQDEDPNAQSPEEQQELQAVEKELEQNLPKEIVVPEKKYQAAPMKANYQDKFMNEEEMLDWAVVQKNYLPKTNRFQLFLAPSLLPSDVFYKTYGFTARAGVHMSERWGVELNYTQYWSSKSSDLLDLESVQGLTALAVAVQNYIFADIYFNQVYGKVALLDRYIIPFELYNILAVGTIQNQNKENLPAATIGIGNSFAINRSNNFRVELGYTVFQAKTSTGGKQTNNFVMFNFGWGHLMPGPTYR